MKKSVYFLSAIAISILMMSASDGVAEIQNKDRTGTPDGDNNCSQCHNDGNFSGSINISVQDNMGAEVNTYIPGETYTVGYLITSTGNPSGYGFQSTVLLEDLSNAGTLLNPSANAQLESVTRGGIVDRHMVEHNASSPTGLFSVEWVAPASAGDITFYASGNIVNGDNDSDGDRGTPSTTLVLTPDPSIDVSELESDWLSLSQNGNEVILNGAEVLVLDRMEVFNIQGQQIDAFNNINLPFEYNLDASGGIYILVFQNEDQLLTRKILL